jgi:hypothetical protein
MAIGNGYTITGNTPTTGPEKAVGNVTYTAPSASSGGAGTTGPSAGGSTTLDANGNPITDQDAVALISTELSSWGFGQDAVAWATQQIQSNNSIDQILYSMRQQPFYVNSIFGQVAAARSAAGLPAMTEAQILSYQDTAMQVAQESGMPPGMVTTPELVALMGADVSTTELDQRITDAFSAVAKADPNTLKSLQADYGLTQGQIAAYYLDPTKALPLIQNQFTAAQAQGAALTAGYGPVSASDAMLLAQLGVSQNQAQTGFTALAKQEQLFNALPGEQPGETPITQEVQLGAEFGGNAQDQQAITEQAQQREAVFQGNYHFAETQGKGITGLGTTERSA